MHINQLLWRVYLTSSPQQSAVASLVSELERYELLNGDQTIWRQFAAQLVCQLSLYGFCLYKLHRDTPQIYNAKDVELRLVKGRLKPYPILKNAGPQTGWRLFVLERPQLTPNGQYVHPMSAAYRCKRQAEFRIELEQNMLTRDTANATPTVYTRVANNIAAAPGASRPWFQHGSTVMADVGQRIDLDDLMRHREETIQALDRITDNALRRTPTGPLGGRPIPKRQQHREFAVSDGRDMTEMRTLEQSTVIVHNTIERLAHEIQFAFGVPPQVQGRNVNSERMASSNRLNEQAITHFRATAARFRTCVQTVFSVISDVSYGRQMNTHTLDQIGHFLKPNVLVELYALAHNLKKSDFDLERVKLHTALPEKRQKTDEVKLSAALKRNASQA